MLRIALHEKSKWTVYFLEEKSSVVTDYRGVIKLLDFTGIKKPEILMALKEMNSKGHNSADFGCFGRFLYTSEHTTSNMENTS